MPAEIAENSEIAEISEIGEIGDVDKVDEVDKVGEVSEVAELGELSEFRHVCEVSGVSEFGGVGDVSEVSETSDVSNINKVGKISNVSEISKITKFSKISRVSKVSNVIKVGRASKVSKVTNVTGVSKFIMLVINLFFLKMFLWICRLQFWQPCWKLFVEGPKFFAKCQKTLKSISFSQFFFLSQNVPLDYGKFVIEWKWKRKISEIRTESKKLEFFEIRTGGKFVRKVVFLMSFFIFIKVLQKHRNILFSENLMKFFFQNVRFNRSRRHL